MTAVLLAALAIGAFGYYALRKEKAIAAAAAAVPAPRSHVFVPDAGLSVTQADLERFAPALQAQLREEFATEWGVGVGDVVRTDGATNPPRAGEVVVRIHKTAPASADAGALAEHGVDPDGVPTVDVYEDLLIKYGIGASTPTLADAVSAAISHELLEARADPDIQRIATLPDGRVTAVEVCDAVQECVYRKLGVCLSDFSTRANFGIGGVVAPFDYLRRSSTLFGVAPGGYAQVRTTDGWQMLTAEERGPAAYRAELTRRGLGRGAKRRRGSGGSKASAA